MNLYNVLSNRYVGMSNFERLFAQKFGGTGGKIEELEGIPPLTFTANGQPLLDYLISGNTEQTGTPTPESPIMPSGCGERTENLCDKNNINQGYYGYADGQYGNLPTWVNTYYIAIKGNTKYTAKFKTIYDRSRWYGFVWFDSDKRYISTTNTDDNPSECELTATSPANASFCVFNICSQNTADTLYPANVIYCMITEGSTAPTSYIPYGYKLPILSNSTTTNIYLGEVETTRRIKKLVLTGEENWKKRTHGDANYTYEHNPGFGIETGLCSHYARLSAQNIDKVDGAYLERTAAIIITDLRFTTTTDFKAFLAAQYANGTPVTVWCAITTEETGIVNEPLMKIGDYADTISMEQAGVSISTNKGSTTLDVETTIKPSNVYIKYRS